MQGLEGSDTARELAGRGRKLLPREKENGVWDARVGTVAEETAFFLKSTPTRAGAQAFESLSICWT